DAVARAQRTACHRRTGLIPTRGSGRVARVSQSVPPVLAGGSRSRDGDGLHRRRRRPFEWPSTRHLRILLASVPAPTVGRSLARTGGLRRRMARYPGDSRQRRLYRRRRSFSADSEPLVDFSGPWLARLLCPSAFNLLEKGLSVADVFFKNGTHFLLHRASVALGERLERLDNLGRHVANG